jgi:hypothetical protein
MLRHGGKMNLEALEVLLGKASDDLNKLGNVLLEALLIMLVVKEGMQGRSSGHISLHVSEMSIETRRAASLGYFYSSYDY